MDSYEATRVVFSRIQNLDPENASKIMGLLLIQDHGEKEMIRLAFGPETLLHSVIVKARKELGLMNNSPPSPSTPPFQNPNSNSRLVGSCGITIPTPPPLTIPSNTCWSSDLPSTDDLFSPSNNNTTNSSSMNSSATPFYGKSDMIDEFQLQEQLSFLNDNHNHGPKSPDLFYSGSEFNSSPTGHESSMLFPSLWGNPGSGVHRRSCSVSDVLGNDDSGFGWKSPCLYYARGYCKNGSNCKFVHNGFGDQSGVENGLVGSPNQIEIMDHCHELLRSKSANQQRLAQLMGGSSFPYSPKSMNFLLQQQQNDTQRAAAALMMADDIQKFNRSRLERNSFDMLNPASRQIYLTFPADSTFREEDVSNYFSIYGPVQDVRIPYQQKRMFGFVTFVYPETVKMILAKGNPHFVCDARVLVKPYKEKGKVPDKYRSKQQPMERGDFSPCGTPTGLDSRDPFDQLGAMMFCNTQDMLWRRKMEEQVDLQQALELQSRRMLGLQLHLDAKKHQHHRALSTGSPIPSPTHSPNIFGRSLLLPPFHNPELSQAENCSSPVPAVSGASLEKQSGKESSGSEDNGSGKGSSHAEESELPESLEHNLPDSPFASPAKAQSNSSLDMASFSKSFNCQMPRFSSSHVYAGTNGPTCPVGI
ncbi:zinc finger CCCH domain-containing protein 46 [Rutidosis leptorrhynchoides]|uniref:zinc finger CCCH domain-containing protein 46 n=1 Tax=Rutidosis leptorrhynchoides TaxID=125765 RepID=UPI003A9A465B